MELRVGDTYPSSAPSSETILIFPCFFFPDITEFEETEKLSSAPGLGDVIWFNRGDATFRGGGAAAAGVGMPPIELKELDRTLS